MVEGRGPERKEEGEGRTILGSSFLDSLDNDRSSEEVRGSLEKVRRCQSGRDGEEEDRLDGSNSIDSVCFEREKTDLVGDVDLASRLLVSVKREEGEGQLDAFTVRESSSHSLLEHGMIALLNRIRSLMSSENLSFDLEVRMKTTKVSLVDFVKHREVDSPPERPGFEQRIETQRYLQHAFPRRKRRRRWD